MIRMSKEEKRYISALPDNLRMQMVQSQSAFVGSVGVQLEQMLEPMKGFMIELLNEIIRMKEYAAERGVDIPVKNIGSPQKDGETIASPQRSGAPRRPGQRASGKSRQRPGSGADESATPGGSNQ